MNTIKKKLERKDITFVYDFLNLTKDDTDKIISSLDLNIPENLEKIPYLFEIKELLFKEQEVRNIVQNRIFAGRTSVKWYKLRLQNEEEKNMVRKRLESENFYYNDLLELDSSSLENPRQYTCIKTGQDKYMVRIMVPAASKIVNDGKSVRKVKNINNIIAFIDLSNSLVEVRSGLKDAKRVMESLWRPFTNITYSEVGMLNKYENSLESFKESLYNGRFVDVLSVPDQNIELTKAQSELLVDILQTLDEYFLTKDIDKLNNELQNSKIDTEGMKFTQLFLAGMSKIGIEVRPDVKEDLSGQSLYSILKEYVTDHRGYIEFCYPEDANRYTIQVGISTNTISFKSSVTEEVIDYIREKIL